MSSVYPLMQMYVDAGKISTFVFVRNDVIEQKRPRYLIAQTENLMITRKILALFSREKTKDST